MSLNIEIRKVYLSSMAGHIAVHLEGDEGAPVVLMAHSILSSSAMWDEQSSVLAANGFRVVRMDTRGHGLSDAPKPPYAMTDLVADSIAIMNALDIQKAHYVGLSLGGMTGFGLAINHPERFHQFIICDARADAPPDFSAPWDDRIAIAKAQGCTALAQATIERWFGKDFVATHSQVSNKLISIASNTSVSTTLLVGANDGPLPQAMSEIGQLISGSILDVINGSGHLPNIDQGEVFNAALLKALNTS